MIDVHNHLQDSRLDPYREEVVDQLRMAGIEVWGVNGTRESDWEAVVSLAENYTEVHPSLGLHPWQVSDRSPDWDRRLESLIDAQIAKKKPIAMGEIGLDKWIRNADLVDQETVFRRQLAIARGRDLAVTIHCLKCWGRLLEVLRDVELPTRGFLLHSYSGPSEMITELIEMGAYFSFSGYFFEPRKAAVRERFCHEIPLDRILLETDAPDMRLPIPEEQFSLASLNHPGNIEVIYKRFAELKGLSAKALTETIRNNFEVLFASKNISMCYRDETLSGVH